MFAGGRRRSSNNVRAMQLFHELKQQFPTIPDHVVSACIANNDQRPADHVLQEVLEAASTLQQELMGRNPTDHLLSPTPDIPDQQQIEPNNRTNKNINNLSIEQKLSKRKTLEHTTKENLSHLVKNTFKNRESEDLDLIKENLEYRNRNLKTHKKSEQNQYKTPVKTEETQKDKDSSHHYNKRDKFETTKEEILPFHNNSDNKRNSLVPQNNLLIGKGFSTFDKNFLPINKRSSNKIQKEENQVTQKKNIKVHQNNLENHLNNRLLKNAEIQKETSNHKEEHCDDTSVCNKINTREELCIQKEETDKESSARNENHETPELTVKNKETSTNIRNLRRRREKFAAYKEPTGSKFAYGKKDQQTCSQSNSSDLNNSKQSSIVSASPYTHHQRLRTDMNQSESDLNRNIIPKSEPADPKKPPKRPDTLDLKSDNRIQQSEKCNNVFKLLHSNKPPKSPGTPKRQLKAPQTRESDKKTETIETPMQTTNTSPPNLNLSLNVNYSVGVVPPKHTTALHVVPQQPWLPEVSSPRSFTSVNLTLRPPSSEPQPPIDITSQNSSLTYSTSTFDSQKGLQSKLQITVSPTGGCVSSIRTRPRSYHSGDTSAMEPLPQQRTGSVQDLSISPIIQKQQARIDKLKIELRLENVRLVALQSEVQKLEAARTDVTTIERTDAELEKQLLREIRHLRGQCERLTVEVDRQTENAAPLGETSEEFYRNIYTGQRGPFNFGLFDQRMTSTSTSSNSSRNRLQQPVLPQSENYGPKWNCSVCTFQNHPLLDSCEQCDMARIVQGRPKPPDLSYLLNLQASLKPKQIVTAANNLLQHVTNNANIEYLRRHSEGVQENGNVDTSNALNNTH